MSSMRFMTRLRSSRFSWCSMVHCMRPADARLIALREHVVGHDGAGHLRLRFISSSRFCSGSSSSLLPLRMWSPAQLVACCRQSCDGDHTFKSSVTS